MLATIRRQLPNYVQLTRLDRPVGIWLLLWPAFWALWVAGDGSPAPSNVVIFAVGVLLMRSAGCVINDYADRNFDGHVERTRNRPLPSGRVSSRDALTLFGMLMVLAFALVCLTNWQTVVLSIGGAALAALYPFMKRYTSLPQLVLGAAFAWSIPMAFTAETGAIPDEAWLLYLATLLWTVAYDTEYAMVDREDDLRIGVRSTATLLGRWDLLTIALLQIAFLLVLVRFGQQIHLASPWYIGIAAAALLFGRQLWMIRKRERDACFKAFLDNVWVGAILYAGLVASYWLPVAE